MPTQAEPDAREWLIVEYNRVTYVLQRMRRHRWYFMAIHNPAGMPAEAEPGWVVYSDDPEGWFTGALKRCHALARQKERIYHAQQTW